MRHRQLLLRRRAPPMVRRQLRGCVSRYATRRQAPAASTSKPLVPLFPAAEAPNGRENRPSRLLDLAEEREHQTVGVYQTSFANMSARSRSQVRLQPLRRLRVNQIHTFNLILLRPLARPTIWSASTSFAATISFPHLRCAMRWLRQ